ncbi:DUF2059 domain-containing protein [Hephaestia sp. GCM10023244]|uniref:DUF2059 domain-containing protein n=1 Tax=unclassified Hephaestia TaxID=2631281 RepID=UPI0020779196|nr:DUF2059 domain-containing protein [Hephaestia sp. MAHUQ-44]MCM8732242.1 DUF2059 domain-containing protein [Hephaestia sp. MAHUQ-44]
MITRLTTIAVALAIPVQAQVQDAASPVVESAAAVDPAALAAAADLLATMKLDDTLDRMFVGMSPLFAESVIGMLSQNPATKTSVDNLLANGEGGHDRFVAILSQEFMTALKARYPEIKTAVAREYAARFTAVELDEITAFYSSGTGAKVLRLIPEIQQVTAAAGSAIGEKAGEEAGRRAFERAEREMLKTNDRPST